MKTELQFLTVPIGYINPTYFLTNDYIKTLFEPGGSLEDFKEGAIICNKSIRSIPISHNFDVDRDEFYKKIVQYMNRNLGLHFINLPFSDTNKFGYKALIVSFNRVAEMYGSVAIDEPDPSCNIPVN